MKTRAHLPDPERDRLVAWNASPELLPGVACRLAAGVKSSSLPGPDAEPSAALGIPLRSRREARRIERHAAELAGRERDAAARLGAAIVTRLDALYPPAFEQLSLPPAAIYLRGELGLAPVVAIVGARQASDYGLEVARWFAAALTEAGVTVVSGFAVGVDAAAHRGALATPGGRTIAVLGCGLDIDYPRGHHALGEAIAASGAILTEFPLGRPPARWQFPVRNRLIAALCDACVVIEAAPRSGSLVTARLALDLGREVLAVPGRVTDELALGTNALLAEGARPALDPRDLLEAIAVEPSRRRDASAPLSLGMGAQPPIRLGAQPPALTGDARALWLAAEGESATAETLAELTALSVDRALATLLELELTGALRRLPDGRYEARR